MKYFLLVENFRALEFIMDFMQAVADAENHDNISYICRTSYDRTLAKWGILVWSKFEPFLFTAYNFLLSVHVKFANFVEKLSFSIKKRNFQTPQLGDPESGARRVADSADARGPDCVDSWQVPRAGRVLRPQHDQHCRWTGGHCPQEDSLHHEAAPEGVRKCQK